jgi:hypothetical protein
LNAKRVNGFEPSTFTLATCKYTDVERLEAESSDPVMTTDHVRAAETFQALSMAHELVRRLYAGWAELEE